MITTATTFIPYSTNVTEEEQNLYMNSLAIAIAEDQYELCEHWNKNKFSEEFISSYDHKKIKINFFKNEDNSEIEVKICCLSCKRRNIIHNSDRFEKTEKILAEKFKHFFDKIIS